MLANTPSIKSMTQGSKFSLRMLSMAVVFPAIVIGPTLLNRDGTDWVLRIIGQVVMLGGTGAVIVVALSTPGRQRWMLLFVAGLLISKAGRIAIGEHSLFYPLYIFFMAFLFSRASATILIRELRMIYRQTIIFCKLSVPLMILQVLGVGQWTQYLRTDSHSYLDDTNMQVATLFVNKVDLVVTTFQARPTGLCHANNVLSPLIIFALGLHYGIVKTSRLTFNDAVLCSIVVLAMSKLVFLSFGIIMLWLLIFSDNHRRRKIMKVILLFGLLMAIYRFFFPGLYSYNIDIELIKKNFFGRASVLAESLPEGMVKGLVVDAFGGHPYFGWTESVSGYSVISKRLNYVIVAALFAVFFYWRGFKRLRKVCSELENVTVLFFFICLLMPLGNWFAEGPMFWFIAGFGFLPLFLLLDGDAFQRTMKCNYRRV